MKFSLSFKSDRESRELQMMEMLAACSSVSASGLAIAFNSSHFEGAVKQQIDSRLCVALLPHSRFSPRLIRPRCLFVWVRHAAFDPDESKKMRKRRFLTIASGSSLP